MAVGEETVPESAEVRPAGRPTRHGRGLLRSREQSGLRVRSVLLGPVYAVYTWLLFPVLARALLRQIGARREWSRTDRVALEPVAVTDDAAGLREESRAA